MTTRFVADVTDAQSENGTPVCIACDLEVDAVNKAGRCESCHATNAPKCLRLVYADSLRDLAASFNGAVKSDTGYITRYARLIEADARKMRAARERGVARPASVSRIMLEYRRARAHYSIVRHILRQRVRTLRDVTPEPLPRIVHADLARVGIRSLDQALYVASCFAGNSPTRSVAIFCQISEQTETYVVVDVHPATRAQPEIRFLSPLDSASVSGYDVVLVITSPAR